MIHRAAFVIQRAEVFRLQFRRQLFDELQSLRVMLFRFRVAVELRRVIARVIQIFDGASEITAAFEVHGQMRRDLRRTLAEVFE